MPARPRGRPTIIDTDPGVDDALALMLALRAPELDVRLVSTVAGNVPLARATANAATVLDWIDPPARPLLARGHARPLRRRLRTATAVHGDDGLGGAAPLGRGPRGVPGDAVARIVALARQHAGDLLVVALGPLTNIAAAIEADRRAMRGIGRLVVMGGAIRAPGNVTAAAEFNFWVDPEAADRVLTAGLPTTLVPLDATHQIRLPRARLRDAAGRRPSGLAARVVAITRSLLDGRFRVDGMPLHDPLAVAVAIDPSLVSTERLAVRVETASTLCAGLSLADLRTGRTAAPTDVTVATGVDGERVLELLESRVLGRCARRAPTVVVVGSANTDLAVRVPHLPVPGETVHGASLETGFGGKGANQALAASAAGAPTAFLARLGSDERGDAYRAHLGRSGVEAITPGPGRGRAPPTGAALIVVGPDGANQIAVAPGANAALSPRDCRLLTGRLGPGRVLVTQLEVPLPTVEAALRLARAAGATTILNPAPAAPLPAAIAPLVDILVPNEVEAAALTGLGVADPREAAAAAEALVGRGFRQVAVTLGARGVVWSDGVRTRRIPGHAVAAVDTTGAGDTFVGELAAALAAGLALAQALARANAAAALAVTRPGAQVRVGRAAVDRLLAAGPGNRPTRARTRRHGAQGGDD
ncbi:MAG: nucleoside hydrolase [Chromatiales bacterium]|nr:nucleoside hydrolase [Chromatiales bacterium]